MAMYLNNNNVYCAQFNERYFYVFDKATLILDGVKEDISVEAYDSSKVFIGPNVRVTVSANMNSTILNYSCQAKLAAYNKSQIFNYGDSEIHAYDNTLVITRNSSTVIAHAYSQINAHDNTMVYAFPHSNVHLCDNSSCFNHN